MPQKTFVGIKIQRILELHLHMNFIFFETISSCQLYVCISSSLCLFLVIFFFCIICTTRFQYSYVIQEREICTTNTVENFARDFRFVRGKFLHRPSAKGIKYVKHNSLLRTSKYVVCFISTIYQDASV